MQVFDATCTYNGQRTVCVVKPQRHQGEAHKKRILKEIIILQALGKHAASEHVIRCFGAYTDPFFGFVTVLEKAEWGNLLEVLKFHHLTLTERMDVAVQIAELLCFLADCCLLHRDLKLDNLLAVPCKQAGRAVKVKAADFAMSTAFTAQDHLQAVRACFECCQW